MASPVGHTLMGVAVGALVLHAVSAPMAYRWGLPLARSTSDTGVNGASLWRCLHWRWLLLIVLSANFADLDFLPGALVGDINRWHHTASHSFLAVLIWGFAVLAALTWWDRRPSRLRAHGEASELRRCVGLSAVFAYASHLLLDWLTQDLRAPFGIPLLWPLDLYSLSAWTPFGGIRHGVPGDDAITVFWAVFSWHNVGMALREILVVLPVIGLLALLMRARVNDR